MPYLFFLMILEIMLLAWLHHQALEKNLHSLQRHLASSSICSEGVWVEGDPYSFHLCVQCIDTVLGHR
jgi:hypothetical protein